MAIRQLWALAARKRVTVKKFELLPVRATERTVWLLVRVWGSDGSSGLGEASDAFGFQATTKADALRMEGELRGFFELAEGKPVDDIEAFRQRAWPRANGLVAATAMSAIEQSLWDLAGKSLGVPSYTLWGGGVRTSLETYANINRAVRERTPAGFARVAKAAVADGFRSVKLAPFDGYPKTASVDSGVACVAAVRKAVGPDVAVMVDCHSYFGVPLAVSLAERLRPFGLAWYEEPVAPERTEETVAIRKAISQPMAGGETLFGVAGFEPLIEQKAVDVIMPDVKHCGGLLELTRIAAAAGARGVMVAPHNPSGPVGTAATVQVCAGMSNFKLLELQWGEVGWRGDLVTPGEVFREGKIAVPVAAGFGVTLNERVLGAHRL